MLITETHPSHVLKFCPRCGSAGFSFDGEKKFNCNTCNFGYYINAAAATCAIIEIPDGRIILGKRKFNPRIGTLDLPGGFLDIMERAEDCIIREIHEELGIKLNNPIFLASFPNEYQFNGISYFTCDLAFIFKLKENPVIIPSDDVSEAVLIHPKEIDFNKISFPSIVKVLKMYNETLK